MPRDMFGRFIALKFLAERNIITPIELQEELGWKRDKTISVLHRLVKHGWAERIAYGIFAITEKGKEEYSRLRDVIERIIKRFSPPSD